jgi:hypothetical protein
LESADRLAEPVKRLGASLDAAPAFLNFIELTRSPGAAHTCEMENPEERRKRIADLQKEKNELAEQRGHFAFRADRAEDEPARKSAAAERDRINQRLAEIEDEIHRLGTALRSNRDPDTGLPLK